MASIEESRHPDALEVVPSELPPMRYREFPPDAALAPYVQCYAEFRVLDAPPRPFRHLVMPDGCSHLTYLRPAPPGGALILGGPQTTSTEHVISGPLLCWDVKFRPHGRGLLRQRAAEWGDPSWRRMTDGLAACATAAQAGSVLDGILAPLREDAEPIDDVVAGVVASIEASDGRQPIADIANGLPIGERQLQRRFRSATGITPKQFSRIRRFRACARNLIATRPEQWGHVAIAHGYADQAHLNREFARLSGRTPTQLASYIACIEHQDVEV